MLSWIRNLPENLKNLLAEGIEIKGTVIQAEQTLVNDRFPATKFIVRHETTNNLYGSVDFRHPEILVGQQVTVFLHFTSRFPPLPPETFHDPQTNTSHSINFLEVDY